MAADFNTGVLTAKGLALLAKWQTGVCTPTITKAVAGAGSYSSGESLTNRTSLKSQKISVGISKKTVSDDTTLILRFIISNEKITTGFTLTEVGIYAKDPDEGEILYSIATTADASNADYIPAYNGAYPTSVVFNYQIEVANASSVTIKAGTGAYAAADDFNDLVDDVEALIVQADDSELAVRVVTQRLMKLIEQVENDEGNNEESLSTLASNVNALSANLTTLSGNVSSLSTNLTALSKSVDTMDTNVNTLESNLKTLSETEANDVGELTEKDSDMELAVRVVTQRLMKLAEQVEDDEGSRESDYSELSDKIDSVEEELSNSIDSVKADLSSDISTTKEELDAAKEELDAAKEDTHEVGTATLTNSNASPLFNSTVLSPVTVSLAKKRSSVDYLVNTQILEYEGGRPGAIEITDRLTNGFKAAYTGSATSVTFAWEIVPGLS